MSSTSLSPSRVAIALLCAGALAFACGPRSHSEAASTARLATASPVLLQGGPRVHNEDSRLATRVEVKVERDGVHFALRVTTSEERLRVEVSDSSQDPPRLVPIHGLEDHGRGLHLVDALSASWGVDWRDQGKAVWFELALGRTDASVATA